MNLLKNLKIAIIDDTPMVIRTLEFALSSFTAPSFSVLFTLNSLSELKQLEDAFYEPDIIICDINMPGVNGINGLPILKKRFPECMVIMHSDSDDTFTVIEAIHAGANGYLKKGLGKEDLFNAILRVVEGCLYISPVLTRKIFEVINYQTYPNSELTPRESEIVDGIVKGLSYKLIGYRFNISINTVREHIKKIYKKMNVNSKGELMALYRNAPALA